MMFRQLIYDYEQIAMVNDRIYYLYDGDVYSFDVDSGKKEWLSNPMGWCGDVLSEILKNDRVGQYTNIAISNGMMENFLELLALEYQYSDFDVEWEKVKSIVEGIYNLYGMNNAEKDFIESLKSIDAFEDFQEATGYQE